MNERIEERGMDTNSGIQEYEMLVPDTNKDEYQKNIKENNEEETNVNSTVHNPTPVVGERCRCGCVPDMMSLFEMAALRAQKKKEKRELQLKLLQQREKETPESAQNEVKEVETPNFTN